MKKYLLILLAAVICASSTGFVCAKTTTNASGDTIYFPVSVSASSFVGFSIIGSWNDSPIMYHVRTLNQTANSITVVGIQHLGTSTSRQTVNFYWYVTGPATE